MRHFLKRSLSVLLAITIIFGSAYVGLSEVDFSGLFAVKAQAASESGVVEFNGHLYEMFDDALSWVDAKAKCEELGGHLVTITSQDEQDLVEGLADESSKINLWLGAYICSNNTFEWITGENFNYTNWDENEPNNTDSDEYHLMMYTSNGLWNDEDNTGESGNYALKNFGFICEWDNISSIKSDYSVLSYSKLKNIDNSIVTYENSTLNIVAEDYYTVDINDCTLIQSAVMVFGAIPTSTNSHISAVHCNGYDAIVEAENVKFPVSGQDADDEKIVSINAYTDLDDFSEFQLLQNGTVLQTSTTGSFNLVAKSIPSGDSLEVRVVGSDGKKHPKIETNIKTYEAKTDFSVQGSKISVTLPEDIFIVGGAEFELDLEDLPVFIMRSDDSIKIGIGASKTSEFTENGETENSQLWGDWKNLVDNLKDDYLDGMIDYGIYSFIHDFDMGNFFSSTGFVPKGSAKICAYAEFRYADGEWVAVGGNGCFAVSIKVSNEWQTFVWAAPIVIKLEGSVGANADFSVGFDFDEGRWYADCDIDFTLPEIRGSVGVGIAHVFDGSAYLKLKNSVKVSYKNEYISCVLNGELGLSGKFLCFSGEKSLWNFLDWQYYYNSWATMSSLSSPVYSGSSLNSNSIYDKDSYSIDTREHLETQSEWYGSYNFSTFSNVEPIKYTEKLLQESVYEAVNPKTVTTSDGKTMMVWTADIAERTTGNHTAIVYSIYDNELGIWSEPQIVCDDGTADSYPDVIAYGDNIYIAWVNVNKDFDETVTVEQMAEACEISVAYYNNESTSFTKIADLTNDAYFNYLPVVTATDDTLYVGYAENTGNSPFIQDGENSLYISTVNSDGTYTTEKVIASSNPITGVDIGFLDGKLNLGYLMDMDSDITTSDDIELFIYDDDKQIVQITDNNVSEQSIQFAKINDVDSISYYCSDNIYYFNDISKIDSIMVSENSILSPEYRFIDDENGTVLISKAISTENGATNIYASVYSGDSWLNPVKITDSEIDIKSFDVYKTNDNCIGVTYSKSKIEVGELTEEETGKYTGTYNEVVDLYSTSFARYDDFSLNNVTVNEKEITDGNVLATINVTNNGLTTLDSFTLTVQTNEVDVYQTTVDDLSLFPGETRDIDVYVSLGEIENLSEYIFIADVSEKSDVDLSNNEKTIQLGYVDIDVSLDRSISDGKTSGIVLIKNNSCISTGMQMVLRKNSYDGDIVSKTSLPIIDAFEETKYYINPEFISENFIPGDAVCVEIISSKDEKVLGNNYQFFTVSEPEVETFEYTILENNCIEITKYNGGNSVVVIPKTYDDYTVTSIASNVFSSEITSITLPSSIENIGGGIFNGATALTEIIIDDESVNYCDVDGILYNYDKTKIIRVPEAYAEDDLEFLDSVVEIGEYAFYGCLDFSSVVVPDSVTSIGAFAFKRCENLTSVTLSNNIITIGEASFRYCYNLSEISLPDSAVSIGKYAFAETAITELTLPENIASIGTYAFSGCENLQKLNYNARNCTLNISNVFIAMLNHPFKNTPNLTEVTIGENVEAIPSYMFYGRSSIVSVHITDMEKWCGIDFQGVNANPINVAEEVYLNDELITELVIPKTVEAIGDYAFYNFTGLTSVTVPVSVISIGTKAFYNCSDLKYVFYGGSADDVGNIIIGSDSEPFTNAAIHYNATGHIYENEWTIDVAPTCTEDGVKSHHCTYCEVQKDVSSVKATGHKYPTKWTIDVAPTCTEDGSKSHHCTNCGNQTDITSILATGHNYILIDTLAGHPHTDTYTCSYCGSEKTEDYVLDSCIVCNYGTDTPIKKTDNSDIDFDNLYIHTSLESCKDIMAVLSASENVSIEVTASYIFGNLELYGTGTVITVFDGNEYVGDFTLVVEGDTNGDSVCDVLDAWQVAKVSNGHEDLDGAYALAADSNEDDYIDIYDYQAIVNKAVS